jgi:hypothetical protein
MPLILSSITENLAAFSLSLFFTESRLVRNHKLSSVFGVMTLLKFYLFVGLELSRRYWGKGTMEDSAGAKDLRKSRELALLRS